MEYLIYTAGFLVEFCFTYTDTVGLLGRPPRLAQRSWALFFCFVFCFVLVSNGVSYFHGSSVSMEYFIYTHFLSQWNILFTRVFHLNEYLFTRVFHLNEYLMYTSFPSQWVSYLHEFSVSVEYFIYTSFLSQWNILFTRVFHLNEYLVYTRFFFINFISMSILFTRVFHLSGVSYLHEFSISMEYLIYKSFPSQWSILFTKVFRLLNFENVMVLGYFGSSSVPHSSSSSS